MSNDGKSKTQYQQPLREIIGKTVKHYRQMMGLSQREMAKRVSINPSIFTRLERGENLPQLHTVYAFADLFGISIDNLVGREPYCQDNLPPSRIDNLPPNFTYFLLKGNQRYVDALKEYMESPQKPEDVAKLILKISD